MKFFINLEYFLFIIIHELHIRYPKNLKLNLYFKQLYDFVFFKL